MKIVIWCVHFKIFKRFIERFSRVRNVDPYQVLPLSILVACSFVINENIYKYVNMFQMITSSELRFYCTKIFPSLSIRQNPAKHGKWAIFCWQINLPLKYSIEIVICDPAVKYILTFSCARKFASETSPINSKYQSSLRQLAALKTWVWHVTWSSTAKGEIDEGKRWCQCEHQLRFRSGCNLSRDIFLHCICFIIQERCIFSKFSRKVYFFEILLWQWLQQNSQQMHRLDWKMPLMHFIKCYNLANKHAEQPLYCISSRKNTATRSTDKWLYRIYFYAVVQFRISELSDLSAASRNPYN